MSPRVKTAWILAAGLGTRLRPLTDERPKPLVEVCGTPLVVHCLELLHRAGVTRAALNSHWLHPMLPEQLGPSAAGVELHYTWEPEILGTGGGLCGLWERLPPEDDERVVVANADALIDLDVRAFLAMRRGPLSTLVLKEVADPHAYGAIGTDDEQRVVTFAGRIEPRTTPTRERMFCGWHLLEPRVLEVLPRTQLEPHGAFPIARGEISCINKQGYPAWLREGADLRAFNHEGLFVDVGTPERLWEANRSLLAGELQVKHLQPFARFEERPGRVFVSQKAQVASDATLQGPCLVDDDAVIEEGARVGPFAVIGKGCVVERGTAVDHAVLQSGARVHGRVAAVIVGANCVLSIAAR